MISSAPARRDTKRAVMEMFRNSGLFELYGSTEAGWVTMLHPHEQFTNLGSVGRECVGSAPIRLLDEDGHEVPDGEPGELYSCNPYTFDGYWKLPEKTKEAFRGEYCTVGDMARRDADGYIHLVDRKSNMIISGGENVYPSEVEACLGAHPSVKDVAVVGFPTRNGASACMPSSCCTRARRLSEAELLDWCKDRMAGYKRPRSFSFMRRGRDAAQCDRQDPASRPQDETDELNPRIWHERPLASGKLMNAVLNAALPIFALIFAGYLCGRFGLFSRSATDSLNRFAIYLALPALMFLAMSKITPDQVSQVGFALAFSGGIAITFALGFGLSRWRGHRVANREYRRAGRRVQQRRFYGHSAVPSGVRAEQPAGGRDRNSVHGLCAVPVLDRFDRVRPAQGRKSLAYGAKGPLRFCAIRCSSRRLPGWPLA